MFGYFYEEIFKKTVTAFGTLFNDIYIKHKNDEGKVVSSIRVPLAYGPTQKFLARLTQVPNLNKPVQVILPRMSFELIGISYDSSRKATQTQTFLSCPQAGSTDVKKAYLPVPYNMNFELSIMTKLNEDMLQIIEQILPYFQPDFKLSIILVDSIKEKRDIPIVLDNISMTDNYEGDFTERRALIYTLKFTAKTYIFGPVSPTYTYGSIQTILLAPMLPESTRITVEDSSKIQENAYVKIGSEELLVTQKSDNVLTVDRGQNGTTANSADTGTIVSIRRNEIIERVKINYISGDTKDKVNNDMTYTVTPRAIKNYTGITQTIINKNINETDRLISVEDSSNIPENSYIDINGEEIYVDFKEGNTLIVKRAQDKTTALSHISGSSVKLITDSDNKLVSLGDTFGFLDTLE
jgi:hypothetical protein